VGFISDLPTLLVAAFRATLEEVQEAEIILHVHDSANSNCAQQAQDVHLVLSELGVDPEHEVMVNVFNKIDQLEPEQKKWVTTKRGVPISAITKEGLPELLDRIDDLLLAGSKKYTLTLGLTQGKELAWLHAHGKVTFQRVQHEHMKVRVLLKPGIYNQFCQLFSKSLEKQQQER
jgi:GTP-binding protein HflX